MDKLRKISICLLFFWIYIFNGHTEVAHYKFSQQYNDSCHLSPIVNYKLLKKFKNSNYQMKSLKAYNRMEWVGVNQKHLQAWHYLVAEINAPNFKKKYPDFYVYLEKGIKQGPILPHIYKKSGRKRYLPFKGIDGALSIEHLPTFLIDSDKLSNTSFKFFNYDISFRDIVANAKGLRVPIGLEGKKILIFNKKNKIYMHPPSNNWFTVDKKDPDDIILWVHHENILDKDRETYILPKKGEKKLHLSAGPFGLDLIAKNKYISQGIQYEGKSYLIYGASLYHLILFNLGIDSDNNLISEGHPLFKAYQDFRRLMDKDLENPWHSSNFNYEDLLQYHIANLLKEDPGLKDAVGKVSKLYTSDWKNYQKVTSGNYYDHNMNAITKSKNKNYAMGEEQALAYYFTKKLRLIWYLSLSRDAFKVFSRLKLPDFFFKFYAKHNESKANKIYYVDYTHKCSAKNRHHFCKSKTSFLEVWNYMREKIIEKTNRDDFISFDGHGWVVSFDPVLIKMQNSGKSRVSNYSILKSLNMAGIESWLSSYLKPWYKVY